MAPAIGGIPLSHWTAHHLSVLCPRRPEVLALYTERERETIVSCRGEDQVVTVRVDDCREVKQYGLSLRDGEKITHEKTTFRLQRGFAQDIEGMRVLEVEDVLSTGGSAKRTAAAIVQADAELLGLAVLANGGAVVPETCGVSFIEALMTVERRIFTEKECLNHGMCAEGIEINTKFGHGAEFLQRQAQTRS